MVETGSVSRFQDDGPSFFKIILNGQAEELRIPAHFRRHISSELSDAVLKGPSGNHWNVKVSRNARGVFLQDGWQDFARDHSLGNSEFLVFTYDGNIHFRVRIFGKNGLEKLDFPTTSNNQEDDASEGSVVLE